jgi:hypothetical protein
MAPLQPARLHRTDEVTAKNHCEDGHQLWPAEGRHTRHTADTSRRAREEHYATDVGSLRPTEAEGRRRPRLGLVDLDTGEINDL